MAAPARKPQSLPTPAEIIEQLEALRAQKPELHRRMQEEAELSVGSGDKTRYDAAVEAVVAHDQNIRRLEAALSGAEARTKAEAKAQQLAAKAAADERFCKRMERLPLSAQKVQDAAFAFVQAYSEHWKNADEAYVAYPNGPPPSGLGLTNTEIMQQVSAELYRVGATVPITGRPQLERQRPNIPGAAIHNHMLIHQPEKIPPFSVVVDQCVQTARNSLEVKHAA
jgi:hypothetical protein